MVEDKNFLTKEQKDFISKIILSSNFPYYANFTTVPGKDNNTHFNHVVIRRPEERKENEPLFNSPYANEFIDIFKSFIVKNKINTEEILRCSVNLTFRTFQNKCPVHEDHSYPHKQLLIYLNDCKDKEAKTVILDKTSKKIINKITPEQYKGICFDSCPHYMVFPKKDVRIVLVYTFR